MWLAVKSLMALQDHTMSVHITLQQTAASQV